MHFIIKVSGYLCNMLKQTLIQAVREGAKVLQHYFEGEFKISHKEGINNLVTEADHESERVIFDVIRNAFPDHNLLGEETGSLTMDSAYKWIVDPIDGTVNFANGIPLCCVSIGLEYDGEIIMGAVYNPIMNEFFIAERGLGATLNDKKIAVSLQPDLHKACLVTGFPYTYLDMENGPLDVFSKFIRAGIPVRRLGSAAIDLCWVAAGRFDGFYEHKLEAWDSAAGLLIVQEAGGKVTNLKGEAYSPYQHGIVATNGLIHNQLVASCNGQWLPEVTFH